MTIETVLDKIRKLLALSTSSNEHEAARAAAVAAELMRKYQIEEAAIAVENAPEENVVGDNVIETFREVPRWRAVVAMGVCDSLNVSCYQAQGQLRFIGRASDVNTVRYLYGYICREIERIAKAKWPEEKPKTWEGPRRWLNGFRIGASQVVRTRLREEKRTHDATIRSDVTNERALMVINKRAEAIATIEKRLKLHTVRRANNYSRGGYQAGQEAGGGIGLGGRSAGALGSGSRGSIGRS